MVGDELVQPIVGCLGFPVAGNATQFVAERALRGTGSDWRVVTSLVQPLLLEDAIRGARAMRFGGLAFTEAHQSAASQTMDALNASAQISGIIQAARRSGEEWMGADLRGDAIFRLLGSRAPSPFGTVVVSDEKLGEVLRQSSPSIALPSETPTTDQGNRGEEGLASTLVIAGTATLQARMELKSIRWAEQVSVVLLDDDSQHATWRDWSRSRGFHFFSPREYQAMMLVEMLRFWTLLEIPVSLVRDALDEYHGW